MVEVYEALFGAGLLVAFSLVLLILKKHLENAEAENGDEILASNTSAASSDTQKKDSQPADTVGGEHTRQIDTPQNETEQQRLARMEKDLAEREARFKAEKMRELMERERLIKRRHEQEALAATHDKPKPPKDELLDERKSILELIRKTEERYAAGEMEEKSFKRILSGYQQRIIDIDIQLRKRRM